MFKGLFAICIILGATLMFGPIGLVCGVVFCLVALK
jgi:hypothetical protein